MVPFERSLVSKYKNRPFAILGVEVGDSLEKAKSFAKENKLNWRSFFDQKGAIADAWKVQGYPTIYFIDHEGVIRGKDVHGDAAIEKMVEELVSKAEKAAAK